jgi:hypothetical protein
LRCCASLPLSSRSSRTASRLSGSRDNTCKQGPRLSEDEGHEPCCLGVCGENEPYCPGAGWGYEALRWRKRNRRGTRRGTSPAAQLGIGTFRPTPLLRGVYACSRLAPSAPALARACRVAQLYTWGCACGCASLPGLQGTLKCMGSRRNLKGIPSRSSARAG